MTEFTNPIKKKLAKNTKNGDHSKLITQQSETPVKTADRIRKDYENKQNQCIMPFQSHSQLNNSSSLRKILLLERKSSRKDFSIGFYQRELMRRKQKYQNQLLRDQQKYENQLMGLEKHLIESMKQEEALDNQIAAISDLKDMLQNKKIQNLSQLALCHYFQDLSLETLLQLNDILDKEGRKAEECQFDEFTYTIETITENMKNSMRSKKFSEQLLLDETLEQYLGGGR